MLKRRWSISWIGHASLLAPFLAFALIYLWLVFGVKGDTWECPLWWEKAGLNSNLWMDIGFVPSLLCGLCGLVSIARGVYAHSTLCMGEGIWACLAALFLIAFYILATF